MPAPIAAAVPPAPAVPAPAAKAAAPPAPNGAAKPAAPPAGKPPAAPEPVVEVDPIIWEGKVDGVVTKVKKSEADRLLSKGKFADKATQEAKEAIKRAKSLAEKLEADNAAARERAKQDTDAWLKDHGIDPDEYAKSKLERKVEEGKMTPDQRRAHELEQENKRLKGEQDKLEQQRQAERSQQVAAQLQKRIESELVGAAKRAGMSLNDESFYAVYESFRDAHELGLLPVDANGLLPHHADRIIEDAMGKLSEAQRGIRENALKLRGDALLEFVGKEAVDAIVAARLEQIRAAKGIQARPAAQTAPAPGAPPQPKSYLTPAEAEAEFKRLAKGGR